jgi:hypothetical protein
LKRPYSGFNAFLTALKSGVLNPSARINQPRPEPPPCLKAPGGSVRRYGKMTKPKTIVSPAAPAVRGRSRTRPGGPGGHSLRQKPPWCNPGLSAPDAAPRNRQSQVSSGKIPLSRVGNRAPSPVSPGKTGNAKHFARLVRQPTGLPNKSNFGCPDTGNRVEN